MGITPQAEQALRQGIQPGVGAFDDVPPTWRVRAYDVDYVLWPCADGGELYLTRYGWPLARRLLPECWYTDCWYAEHGERLSGATGTVYRVETNAERHDGPSAQLVVKFSRVAQDVPLMVTTSIGAAVSAEEIANARFNDPFEEFGLVVQLRRGAFGPSDVRIQTKRPLAIYAPNQRHELWRLGRSVYRFQRHAAMLADDQTQGERAIELDIKREYIMLFGWVEGADAQAMAEQNLISTDEMEGLTQRVSEELRLKGFIVLDLKPKHFILRHSPRRDGDGMLRSRDGRLVYALIDFELLQRSAYHQGLYRASQRARYWHHQAHREEPADTQIQAARSSTNILGVNYIHGEAPNGGRIWAVGQNAELFNFFLPDRWRRTPRMKLALGSSVYRTRTRDGIYLVYRQARVGERPAMDPYYEQGRRIREYGYNSPFEEFAIAERLHRQGLHTIRPRAIYRTGHETARAGHLIDARRYESHSELLTPDPAREPVLSQRHDYYSIWGYFRGIDPLEDYREVGHWGLIDLAQACDERVMHKHDHDKLIESIRARLHNVGIDASAMEDAEFLLRFDARGALERDGQGRLEVTFSMDALTAHECGLLDEPTYRALLESVRQSINAAHCEALNLGGSHLLLAVDPDGQVAREADGRPHATLCNFELIRPEVRLTDPAD